MTKHDSEFQAALDYLNYSMLWVDLGVIDRNSALTQLDYFKKEESKHKLGLDGDIWTEHYRLGALRRFLRRESFSDEKVESLIEIGFQEITLGQKGMGANVFYDMIRHRGLTERQFETVASKHDEVGFLKLVTRERFIRNISKGTKNIDVIQQAVDYVLNAEGRWKDSNFERWLVDNVDLSEPQLERLSQEGVAKAIRNLARTRLQKMRRGNTERGLDRPANH